MIPHLEDEILKLCKHYRDEQNYSDQEIVGALAIITDRWAQGEFAAKQGEK